MTLSNQSIVAVLERLDVPLPLSEVHGLCCGLLCSLPSAAAKTRWFTEVLDAASLGAESVAARSSELKSLDEWFTQTLNALHDTDMEFMPAVPDEATPVSYRIRALGDYCSGFTYGVGIALSQRGQKPLPENTREIIEDFQAIEAADDEENADLYAGAVVSDTDSDEQRESIYSELLEYVRVGVLLVLEELRPVTPVAQEKPS